MSFFSFFHREEKEELRHTSPKRRVPLCCRCIYKSPHIWVDILIYYFARYIHAHARRRMRFYVLTILLQKSGVLLARGRHAHIKCTRTGRPWDSKLGSMHERDINSRKKRKMWRETRFCILYRIDMRKTFIMCIMRMKWDKTKTA